MVGRGREAHPDGRWVWKPSQQGWEESGVPHWGKEGSRGPTGGPVGVRGPSGELGEGARAGKGREFLPKGWEGLGGPPERAGRSWEALLDGRYRSEGP